MICILGMCVSISEADAIRTSRWCIANDRYIKDTYEACYPCDTIHPDYDAERSGFDSTQCDSMLYNAMGENMTLYNWIWYRQFVFISLVQTDSECLLTANASVSVVLMNHIHSEQRFREGKSICIYNIGRFLKNTSIAHLLLIIIYK